MQLNKRFLFITIFVILAIIICILFVISSLPQPLQPITNSPTISHTVESIAPQSDALLIPNRMQLITATFDKPVNENDITISLQKYAIVSPNSINTVNFSTTFNQNIVSIKLNEDIQPYYNYRLVISDKKTGALIFQTIYSGMAPKSTPVPQNNTSLSQYLPVETNSYSLVYSTTNNVYVFSFFYDPASSDDAVTQRQQAITAMNQFIQSKGVDPATVKIDYSN